MMLAEARNGISLHGPRAHLAGFLAFCLFSAFWLWPLPLAGGHRLAGSHDAWLFLWNFWWFDKALLKDHVSPFWTDQVFHPQGVSLYFHALTPLNSLAGALLRRLFDPIAAYNVLFASTFVLSGYFMFALSLRLTGSFPGALVAGYVFAFSPFRFEHLNQLEHLSTQWLALFALALFRLGRTLARRDALLAAGAFTVVFYTNLYYGLFSVVMAAGFFAKDAVRVALRETPWGRVLHAWSVLALAAAAPAAPFLWKMREASLEPGLFKVPFWIKIHQSLDLLSFFTPSFNNPVLGSLLPLEKMYAVFTAGEPVGYIGFAVLLLGVIGILDRSLPHRRFVALLTLLFMILAMGPALHAGGIVTLSDGKPIPLPQGFLQGLPLVGAARVPARYFSVAMLFAALAAGMGAASLARRGTGRARLLLGGLCVIGIIEYWTLPQEVTPVACPLWIETLAEDGEDCAVIDLPLKISTDPGEWWRAFDPATDHGWLQTLHGKRAFTGPISHTALSRRHFTFFLEDPLLCRLVSTGEVTDRSLEPCQDTVGHLQRLKLKYFILHKDIYGRMGAGQWERDRRILMEKWGLKPLYDDGDVSILRSY